MFQKSASAMLAFCALTAAAAGADVTQGLQRGKPELKSAGPLAFGPAGVLFIGDPRAAAIFAIDTQDKAGDRAKASVNVENISEKVGSLLGTGANQVRINDVAVNPAS